MSNFATLGASGKADARDKNPLAASHTDLAAGVQRYYRSKNLAPRIADARAWAEQFPWEPSALGPYDLGDRWEWVVTAGRAENTDIGGAL